MLDKKPLIYVWRPFYRVVFAPLIRPPLKAVQVFFLGDAQERLSEVSNAINAMRQETFSLLNQATISLAELRSASQALISKIDALEGEIRNQALISRKARQDANTRDQALISRIDRLEIETRDQALISRIDRLETETRNQWTALEQLFLAMLSDAERK